MCYIYFFEKPISTKFLFTPNKIHLQYVKNIYLKSARWTIVEKFIVHEFAKLRYGVFEEYSTPGENQFYFSTTFGRLDPVRCTVGLRGIIKNSQGYCLFSSIDPESGEFPAGCAYIPYPFRANGTASMMDHQYVREVNVTANYMMYITSLIILKSFFFLEYYIYIILQIHFTCIHKHRIYVVLNINWYSRHDFEI